MQADNQKSKEKDGITLNIVISPYLNQDISNKTALPDNKRDNPNTVAKGKNRPLLGATQVIDVPVFNVLPLFPQPRCLGSKFLTLEKLALKAKPLHSFFCRCKGCPDRNPFKELLSCLKRI